MYKEYVIKANEVIKKILDYINEHKDAFNYMNLKLYDAHMYYITEFEKDYPLLAEYEKTNFHSGTDYFSIFCDNYYGRFLLECDEYDWEFKKLQHYIGRTSSFYLHDLQMDKPNYIIYDLYNNAVGAYDFDYINLDASGMIVEEEDVEYRERAIEGLEYIINEFYSDALKYCKPIIECYSIIDKYKQYQVQSFKEDLDYYLEDLEN
jgi:hypothetical protein